MSTKLYQQNGIDNDKKKRYMSLLKQLVSFFLKKKVEDLHVPIQDWSKYACKIMHKDVSNKVVDTIDMYALIPIEFGEVGLKKRNSFVRKGNVYMSIDNMTTLVLNLYCNFLREKLAKMSLAVIDLVNNDVDNQMSGFISKTLDVMNNANFD